MKSGRKCGMSLGDWSTNIQPSLWDSTFGPHFFPALKRRSIFGRPFRSLSRCVPAGRAKIDRHFSAGSSAVKDSSPGGTNEHAEEGKLTLYLSGVATMSVLCVGNGQRHGGMVPPLAGSTSMGVFFGSYELQFIIILISRHSSGRSLSGSSAKPP
jgi:hypothetical protein